MGDAALLEEFIEQIVSVITNDGRQFVGRLRGFDQTTNLIMEGCQERVYTMDGCSTLDLEGVVVIRGDNAAVVGAVDLDVDRNVELDNIKADALGPITH